MARLHKLVIAFNDKDALLDWAEAHAPEGTAVYMADALDKEVGGRAVPDTYVLRNRGQKPDKFLATSL